MVIRRERAAAIIKTHRRRRRRRYRRKCPAAEREKIVFASAAAAAIRAELSKRSRPFTVSGEIRRLPLRTDTRYDALDAVVE